MRKFILIFLFATLSLPVFAQRSRVRVEWGAVAGLNVSDFSTSDSRYDIRNRMGWQAGIVTAIQLGAFAVEPQIFYVHQGLRIGEGSSKLKLKSNSIDVPVLLSLRVLRPFRFYVGPVFTVMNDCKQKSGGDLLDFSRIRPSLNFTVGAGVRLMQHLYIDLRYNGQFKGKTDVVLPDDSRIEKLRSKNFAVSFGYLF